MLGLVSVFRILWFKSIKNSALYRCLYYKYIYLVEYVVYIIYEDILLATHMDYENMAYSLNNYTFYCLYLKLYVYVWNCLNYIWYYFLFIKINLKDQLEKKIIYN